MRYYALYSTFTIFTPLQDKENLILSSVNLLFFKILPPPRIFPTGVEPSRGGTPLPVPTSG